MKKLLLALAASTLLFGTAANAAPSPYIETTVGSNSIDNLRNGDVNYGVRLGLENSLNRNLALFAEGGAENFASDGPTTLLGNLGLRARLSGPVGAYGSVGYLNTDGNSGYRLGTGLSLDLTKNIRLRGGVEFDDYGSDVDGVRGTAGLSLRF